VAKMMDRILVIDLESTCWKGEPPEGQQREIIEIGLCVLDVSTCHRLDNPSLIVRPSRSTVSAYCTELTTLTQQDVEAGMTLAEACQILRDEYGSAQRIWASYGDYDRLMFQASCRVLGVEYPFGHRHFNVKSLFAAAHALRREVSLDRAMAMMRWPLEGTHHRGGDDAWNIAHILGHLLLSARQSRQKQPSPGSLSQREDSEIGGTP
jgi:inhibitor of KinA sporulation pathway (predicted exonuclease)